MTTARPPRPAAAHPPRTANAHLPRAATERRRLWAAVVLAAVLFTLLGTPRTAWAHNALVSSTPEAGSTVRSAPTRVVLTFNEPAIRTGTRVLVTGPDGSVTDGDPELVDTTVRQDLAADLPAGEYTVEWRVTSADGHPITGTFDFRVRAAASSSPSATSGASPSASPTASPSTPSTAPTPATPGTPDTSVTAATTPLPDVRDGDPGGASGWWWLLAVVPVGLAALLGWRFSRR